MFPHEPIRVPYAFGDESFSLGLTGKDWTSKAPYVPASAQLQTARALFRREALDGRAVYIISHRHHVCAQLQPAELKNALSERAFLRVLPKTQYATGLDLIRFQLERTYKRLPIRNEQATRDSPAPRRTNK